MEENINIEQRRKKRHKRKNVFLWVVIVALLVSTGCTVYMNIDNPQLHSLFSGFGIEVMNGQRTVDFEKTEKYAISNYGGDALIARNSEIMCVDSNMNTKWSLEKNNTFPVIKTKDKYALVYNFDVPNAVLIKNGKGAEIITDNGVIGGSVNENGYFVLITREKGYKAQVIVYTDNGETVYKWHSADSHIIDAEVSPDNKTLAVATVDFTSNAVSGGIMMFNFSQDKPHTGVVSENNIIMDLEFTGKNALLATGDTGAAVYDILGEKKAEYLYGGKLANYDVDSNGNLVVAVNSSDSAMSDKEITILNKSLKEKGRYSASGTVSCVDSLDGNILVVSDRTISVLSQRGNEVKKLDVNKDIKDAVLFGNGDDALIASGSTAEIVNLK